MAPQSRAAKVAIATGVAILATTAFGVSIYLPFMSEESKVRREQHASVNAASAGGGTRGSMWKNLDKEIKSHHIPEEGNK